MRPGSSGVPAAHRTYPQSWRRGVCLPLSPEHPPKKRDINTVAGSGSMPYSGNTAVGRSRKAGPKTNARTPAIENSVLGRVEWFLPKAVWKGSRGTPASLRKAPAHVVEEPCGACPHKHACARYFVDWKYATYSDPSFSSSEDLRQARCSGAGPSPAPRGCRATTVTSSGVPRIPSSTTPGGSRRDRWPVACESLPRLRP